jgi:hypothetical protein
MNILSGSTAWASSIERLTAMDTRSGKGESMIDISAIVKGIHELVIRDVIFLSIGAVWGILFGRVNKKITEWIHTAAKKIKEKLT